MCFWKMFGPVPRSPSGRSPSLCRWWRSAGVAGSAGAPTPRGSCRGVHRRKREPVRGLLAAPTCTHPPLAGCSVEACNLSLGIRGGKTEEVALPSRRTIRCAERKNREKNLVKCWKKSWRRCTQLSSFRFDRFDRALKTLLSILCMQIEFHFLAHFQLIGRDRCFSKPRDHPFKLAKFKKKKYLTRNHWSTQMSRWKSLKWKVRVTVTARRLGTTELDLCKYRTKYLILWNSERLYAIRLDKFFLTSSLCKANNDHWNGMIRKLKMVDARCTRCCNEYNVVWRRNFHDTFSFINLDTELFHHKIRFKSERIFRRLYVDAWLRSVFGEWLAWEENEKNEKKREKRGVRERKKLKVNPFHWSNAENRCKK